MSSNFPDRGIREYDYHILPGKYALQKEIQLAGLLDERAEIGRVIDGLNLPEAQTGDSTRYRGLVENLVTAARDKATLVNWQEVSSKILGYFDTNLPIYADPTRGLSAPGFILDTAKRELRFFDGSNTTSLCTFTAPKDWMLIQNLFPALFNPSTSVRLGIVSNYTTLLPKQYLQLMHAVLNVNPAAQFERSISKEFIVLYSYLNQYAAMSEIINKEENYRTAEQIVKDIVEELQRKIHTFLTDASRIDQRQIQILTEVIEYLGSGDYRTYAANIAKLEGGWITQASKMFYSDEIDDTLNMITALRSSPFFEEGLRRLATQRERLERQKEYAREEASKRLEDDEYSRSAPDEDFLKSDEIVYDSHIVDFASSEDSVNEMWQQHRVTKAAIQESLAAMAEKITEVMEDEDNKDVELPAIPLPVDLLPEGVDPENKTVVAHIQDCITRLQEKAKSDPSKKTFYQADCALLQNAINKILHFQFAGGEEDEEGFMFVSEVQRRLYNDIGEELTEILNNTKKQPLKEAEYIGSIKPVRAEIHRLMRFHDKIRERLSTFQEQLVRLDQTSFANDIKKFVKKDGPFDTKQKELQGLLNSLEGLPEEDFNVIASDENMLGWQKQIVAVVNALNEAGTVLVDGLQRELLYQPKTATASVEGAPKAPRAYISVISRKERKENPEAAQRKDQQRAALFAEIMQGYGGINEFAAGLQDEEAPRLTGFFGQEPELDVDLDAASDLGSIDTSQSATLATTTLRAPGHFGAFGKADKKGREIPEHKEQDTFRYRSNSRSSDS